MTKWCIYLLYDTVSFCNDHTFVLKKFVFWNKFICSHFQSYIRCKHVDYCSQKEEAFYDIQLNVKGKKNGKWFNFIKVVFEQ